MNHRADKIGNPVPDHTALAAEISASRWPHVGAVLAGGLSTRMGQPKHELELPGGGTMLNRVLTTMDLVCERVAVVGSLEKVGNVQSRAPVIEDVRSQVGPLGGIESLLASGLDSQYLVCPCDVPRVSEALLRLLVHASPEAMAVVPHVVGREHAEPLPARLSAAALPVVTRLLDQGERAVWRLMRDLNAIEVSIPAEWSDHLININTPSDLSAWLGTNSPTETGDR